MGQSRRRDRRLPGALGVDSPPPPPWWPPATTDVAHHQSRVAAPAAHTMPFTGSPPAGPDGHHASAAGQAAARAHQARHRGAAAGPAGCPHWAQRCGQDEPHGCGAGQGRAASSGRQGRLALHACCAADAGGSLPLRHSLQTRWRGARRRPACRAACCTTGGRQPALCCSACWATWSSRVRAAAGLGAGGAASRATLGKLGSACTPPDCAVGPDTSLTLWTLASALPPPPDALVANLTVAEMLGYTCELRSPPGTPATAVHERVDDVIDDLGLRVRGAGDWCCDFVAAA